MVNGKFDPNLESMLSHYYSEASSGDSVSRPENFVSYVIDQVAATEKGSYHVHTQIANRVEVNANSACTQGATRQCWWFSSDPKILFFNKPVIGQIKYSIKPPGHLANLDGWFYPAMLIFIVMMFWFLGPWCDGESFLQESQSDTMPVDLAKVDSVTEATVERMVRPESLAQELQALEINRVVKRTGGVINCFHCGGTGIMTVALDKGLSDSLKVIPAGASPDSRKCYLCNGTGKISEFLTSYDAPSKGRGRGNDDDAEEEEENECLICMSEQASYGLSPLCDHFFCVDCIPRYLETVMKEGRFPAFCPQCREDATERGESQPRFGSIEESGLSFLHQKGCISKEFMMRFILQMRRAASEGNDNSKKTFFKCPATDCKFYILEEPIEYMIIPFGEGNKKVVQLGQCACGAHVCPICKKEQPEQLEACTEDSWSPYLMKGKEVLAQLPDRCTVVREYKPVEGPSNEWCLELSVGEEIVIFADKENTGPAEWCYGLARDGAEGWFPMANVRMHSDSKRPPASDVRS